MRPSLSSVACLAITAALWGTPVAATTESPPAETSDTELAKQTQNPVADLISVPFQSNFNFNTGPEDKTVWVLNVQPVIPIPLGDDWNLITRWITPIINQPELAPGIDHAFGLGTSTRASSCRRQARRSSSGVSARRSPSRPRPAASWAPAREALRKSLDVVGGECVERRGWEVGDG